MTELKQQDIDFLEGLKEEAVFLFEHITENGIDEERAVEMVKVIVRDNDLYLRKSANITVPIRFKLDWLEENADWGNMDYKERDKLLWNIGMDTKNYKYEEGKLFCGENTPQGYTYDLVDYVYGQERLDHKWINMKMPVNNGTNFTHYASEEARDYVWLRKHGRGV